MATLIEYNSTATMKTMPIQLKQTATSASDNSAHNK